MPCDIGATPGIHYRKTGPVYETHPQTGAVFENVVALRTAKLMNTIDVMDWAPHVEIVRYEDLMAYGAQGATRWLKALQKKYHLPCKNRPFVQTRVAHRARDRVTQQMHQAQAAHNAIAHRASSSGACTVCVVGAGGRRS